MEELLQGARGVWKLSLWSWSFLHLAGNLEKTTLPLWACFFFCNKSIYAYIHLPVYHMIYICDI